MLPDIDFGRLPSLLQRAGAQLSEETAAELGTALAAAASTSDPVTAATFVAMHGGVGLLQNKTVELGGKLEQEVYDRIEALEDEESRAAGATVALLRRLAVPLPDSDQWDQAIVQSANGDPDDLIELLEMYANDATRQRRLENTVEDIFEGDVDLAEGEDFIEYLCEQFETDDRSEALTTFLDVSDLLTSRTVHETAGRLADIETDVEAVEAAVDDGRERLQRLLDRDLRSEGFHRANDAYIRTQPSKTPAEAWASGMNLRQIAQQEQHDRDYPVERPVILDADPESEWATQPGLGERLGPDDIAAGLAAGRNLLIQGKPGSGKSVICRLVIDAWRDEDDDTESNNRGTVFYRPSGGSPFTEPGPLIGAIDQAETPALVVVEDAARPEVRALYEVMAEHQNDDSVAFLLNARYGEWSDFDPFESAESDLARQLPSLTDRLPKARPAPLDAAECGRIVEHYEELTGQEIPLPGEDENERGVTLYERIETGSRAGEMLHLTFLLAGGEGLRADARAKATAIERPGDADDRTSLDRFDHELVRHAGLLTALLGAADGQPFRREYLFALAAELSEAVVGGEYTVKEVETLLKDAFDGWLVFDGTKRRRYRTYHQYWSFLFLRALMSDDESEDRYDDRDENQSEPQNKDDRVGVGVSTATVHERFARCLQAALALQTSALDGRRERQVRRRISDLNRTVFDEVATDGDRTVIDFVEDIYGIGTDYPILTPMYRDPNFPALDLDTVEGVPTEAVVRAKIATGQMYRDRGGLDIARSELEQCGDLLTRGDSTSPALESKRQRQLAGVFRIEGQLNEAGAILEESYDRLSTSGDDYDAVLTEVCREIGTVRLNRGNFHGAKRWYERAQEHAIDRLEEAAAVNGLGRVERNRGNLDAAERLHRRSLDLNREIGDKAGEAANLGNLGLVEETRGNLDAAERLHRQSLDLNWEIGDKSGEAACLNNLGNVEETRGNLDAAERLHRQSLNLKREIGDKAGEATSLNNLGNVEHGRDNLDAAERLHRRSLGLKREIGDKPGEARSLYNIGLIDEDRANLRSAAEKFETASRIRTDIGAIGDALSSLSILHRVADEMDDSERALDTRNTVFDLVRENEDWVVQNASLGWLFDWFIDHVPSGIPNPTERVRDLHYLGCRLITIERYDDAEFPESVAWELRKEFDPDSDDHAVALAAGAGIFALFRYLDSEDAEKWENRVLGTIRDAEISLSGGAAALFERLDTGATETTPEELRTFADSEEGTELERTEARAFAHLLELLDEQ